MRVLLCNILFIACLFGCKGQQVTPHFKVIWQDSQSNIALKKEVVLDTLTWQQTFELINKTRRPAVKFPTPDWHNKYFYISSGSQTTSGFQVVVDSVINQNNTTQVYFHIKKPSPTDFVAQVITTPVLIGKIVNAKAQIIFIEAHKN